MREISLFYRDKQGRLIDPKQRDCYIITVSSVSTSLHVVSPKSQQTTARLSIWHIFRSVGCIDARNYASVRVHVPPPPRAQP